MILCRPGTETRFDWFHAIRPTLEDQAVFITAPLLGLFRIVQSSTLPGSMMTRAYNVLPTELDRAATDAEVAGKLGRNVENMLDIRSARPDATSLNQCFSSKPSQGPSIVTDQHVHCYEGKLEEGEP